MAIGEARRRVDGEGKVRGTTRYAGDLPVHGLLHARLVLAAEAHGRIERIDRESALAVPGVVAVLTAADLPIVDGVAGRVGEPLAREEIVFSGQPVALVVAESEAAATDGVDAVVVEVGPLPTELDVEAASGSMSSILPPKAPPSGAACTRTRSWGSPKASASC